MYNIKYAMISKDDIVLNCGLRIKQYSIDEIEKSIGYQRYESILWSMSRYSYEFKFDLEDNGVDYNTLDTYDIFIMLNAGRSIKDLTCDLEFVFGEEFNAFSKGDDMIFVSSDGLTIDKDTIKEIIEAVYMLMFFEKPKERKPANEKAKALIKKQLKLRTKDRVKYDIYSIMESIVWHKNSSYKYEDIVMLSPRQIYSGYKNIKKIADFDNTIEGIYAGVIESDKINFEKINWINEI